MQIACYCGYLYRTDDTIAVCPECGEPTDLPKALIEEEEDNGGA